MVKAKRSQSARPQVSLVGVLLFGLVAVLLWIGSQTLEGESRPVRLPALEQHRQPFSGDLVDELASLAKQEEAPVLLRASSQTLGSLPEDGESPESFCRVKLRVVDASGVSIAGAEVRHGRAYGPAMAAAETRTGLDGSWSADVSRQEGLSWWGVEVAAVGYQPASLVVPFLPASSLELGLLRLEPSRQLTGRVIDRFGVAVPGARVDAVAVRRSVSHSEVRSASSTVVTDARGQFALELSPIPENYDVRLVAWHAVLGGPFEHDLGDQAELSMDPVDVQLGDLVPLRGLVLGSDGRALAGAVVTPTASYRYVLDAVTTGSDGRFELPVAAGRKIRLDAAIPGFIPLDSEPPTVRAPFDEVLIEMIGESELTVVALDSTTGEPLDEFVVSFCSLTEGFSRCHEAQGASGVATLGGLPPGLWSDMKISSSGYYQAEVSLLSVAEFESVGPLTVRLEAHSKGSWVTGRVLSSVGGMVTGAVVHAYSKNGAQGDPIASAKSDAEGSYVLEGLTSGPFILVAVSGDGQTSAPLSGSASEQGWHGVDLVLREPAVLEGRAWSAPGQVAGGALVRLLAEKSDAVSSRQSAVAVSDENGHFTLAVSPGRYRLKAWFGAESLSGGAVAPPIRLELEEGEQRWLDLPLTSRGKAVSGQVRTTKATTGWTVSYRHVGDALSVSDWPVHHVETHKSLVNEHGEYRLEGLPTGRYEAQVLRVDGSLAVEDEVTISPGLEQRLTVDLTVQEQLDS